MQLFKTNSGLFDGLNVLNGLNDLNPAQPAYFLAFGDVDEHAIGV
jgi:hypothetical protein